VFAACTIANNLVYLSLDLNSDSIGLKSPKYTGSNSTDYDKFVPALEQWIFWLYNALNNADLVPGFKSKPAIGPTGPISPGPVLLQYACKRL
jgi:hypothetical protein